MKITILALVLGVTLAVALPASAEILQGDRFITAYDDAVGHRVFGGWQLDRVGDVCVTWHGDTALPPGCYRVRATGHEIAWWNKQYPRSDETLRGAVINAFLTR